MGGEGFSLLSLFRFGAIPSPLAVEPYVSSVPAPSDPATLAAPIAPPTRKTFSAITYDPPPWSGAAGVLGAGAYAWLAAKGDALLTGMVPAFAAMGIEAHESFPLLPESIRQAAWDEALNRLEAEGVPVPRGKIGTYEDYAAFLKDHDVLFPERIRSLRTALTVMDTRDRLYDPAKAKDIGRDRPILVMVGARVDENGALEARQFPTLDKAVRSGEFDVLYFEEDSDTGVERVLHDVHDLTGRRIHTLMLDAHGSRQSLAMGDSSQNEDNDDVDTEDIERDGAFNFLNDYLDPNGQILLLGCSNGAPQPLTWKRFCQQVGWATGFREEPPDPTADVPEFDYFNLAQAFSHVAPGRPVYSSEVPTNLRALSFDPETLRPRIQWMGNREYVALAGLEHYFALRGRLELIK